MCGCTEKLICKVHADYDTRRLKEIEAAVEAGELPPAALKLARIYLLNGEDYDQHARAG